jgi:diaminohydroxyphosphoribosylaminopyrimidine deaminase/5-amino-6-(5-phosphoribosylamino)uracil reductase
MGQALALIHAATHRTCPNPKVGCVIVRDGVVIGQGVSAPAGGPHAEIRALREAGERARGADLYVTLEPCCHHGRTPPCTEAIVAAGIRRVVVGVRDANPKVDGGGIAQLEAAGITVEVGALGEACARQHAPFQRFILDQRPWVILKAATTLDGRIATAEGDSKWITGPEARADVHRVRAQVDAVLVGGETARRDNPKLTVREAPGTDPLRIALDTRLALPLTAHLMAPNTRLYHGPGVPQARIDAVAATGARPVAVPTNAAGRLELSAVLRDLALEANVVRLLVEGGGALHGGLLDAGLVDEALFYVAPKLIGRGRPVLDLPSRPTIAEGWQLEDVRMVPLGPDVRIGGLIRYAAPPSDPEV